MFPTTFKVDGERDDLKDLFHSLKLYVTPPHFLITKDKIQSGLANTDTDFLDLLVEARDLWDEAFVICPNDVRVSLLYIVVKDRFYLGISELATKA